MTVFDTITAADYLDGLANWSLADIRVRRAQCQQLEDSLSYLRRMVQGRLDIVRAEQERRASGAPSDLASLVAALPDILSGHVTGGNGNRLSRPVVPTSDPTLSNELDLLCPSSRLGELPELTVLALERLADGLVGLERSVSDRRKQVFERLDAVSAELARRYRSGEATVDALLA